MEFVVAKSVYSSNRLEYCYRTSFIFHPRCRSCKLITIRQTLVKLILNCLPTYTTISTNFTGLIIYHNTDFNTYPRKNLPQFRKISKRFLDAINNKAFQLRLIRTESSNLFPQMFCRYSLSKFVQEMLVQRSEIFLHLSSQHNLYSSKEATIFY